MLPIRGYLFGPGGYGGLLLFFCHFQTRAKGTAAQSEAASRVFSSVMSRGKLRRGSAGGQPSVSSVRPQIYTRSVNGNAEARYAVPGGVVNAEHPLFVVG